VGSRDDKLWVEVSDLLRSRHGWSIQDSPTPGADANWAFASHGRVDFSVFTDGGLLHFYEEKTDRELQFETVEALTAWLEANKPVAMRERHQEERPSFLRWN
jgi:hypothetical protein